ncbi:MAG: FG-GAP repeat protein [Flavobacteriales bacterium]|jgi:hypothetical protein|nr:FG-GAP repeat protein [Flavobacteriales bacterium]
MNASLRLFLVLSLITKICHGQVGIGTTNPHPSAILEVKSQTKGMLIPRVDNENLIPNPAEGLMIYDKTDQAINYYTGNKWKNTQGINLGNWDNAVHKNKASTPTESGNFGMFMDLSSDNKTLVVSAHAENSSKGAVYIFELENNLWIEKQKIVASDGESNDGFGISIKISADAKTLMISAFQEASDETGMGNSRPKSGAVYIYKKEQNSWVFKQKLKSITARENHFFGSSLAMNSTANKLYIGRSGEPPLYGDVNQKRYKGIVYEYTLNGSNYTLTDSIIPSVSEIGDKFGNAIVLSSDNQTMFISSCGLDGYEDDIGAVYAFKKMGNSWQEIDKIVPQNLNRSAYFGVTLTTNSDGSLLAVGSPLRQLGNDFYAGSVHVFRKNQNNWSLEKEIYKTNNRFIAFLGVSIDFSKEGNTLVLSAHGVADTVYNGLGNYEETDAIGNVYVYQYIDNDWKKTRKFRPKHAEQFTYFGSNVQITTNSGMIIIGAGGDTFNEDNSLYGPYQSSGSIYTYY